MTAIGRALDSETHIIWFAWLRSALALVICFALSLSILQIAPPYNPTPAILVIALTVIILANFVIELNVLHALVLLPALLARRVKSGELSLDFLSRTKTQHNIPLLDLIADTNNQLVEAKTREMLIADFGVEVLVCLDEQMNIRAINESCLKYWKHTRQKLQGKPVATVLTKDSLPLLHEFLAARKMQPTKDPLVLSMNAGDDRTLFCEWQVEWTDTHKLFYCAVKDVTQRKLLELYKQEFVSMISHDLRTPLGNVMMSLELLEAQESPTLSQRGIEVLQTTRQSVHRLISLTEQLLDLEKSDEGKLVVSPDICAVSSLVTDAIAAIRLLAAAKSIEIRQPDNELLVWADEHRIVQVLINLLGNAINFSKKNSVIVIETHGNGQSVEFRVIDQGPGIALEEQSKLFKRFTNVSTSYAGEKKSVGLGLVICKNIIEAHDSKIGVRSTEGTGSTFWFNLKQAAE